MKGIEGVDEEARRAGRRERGSYLGSYMSAFADTGNNELSLACKDYLHRLVEVGIEIRN